MKKYIIVEFFSDPAVSTDAEGRILYYTEAELETAMKEFQNPRAVSVPGGFYTGEDL